MRNHVLSAALLIGACFCCAADSRAQTTLDSGRCSMQVDQRGGIRLQAAQGQFIIESAFSCPGPSIGWNHLGAGIAEEKPSWSVQIARSDDGGAVVTATGKHYSLKRRIVRCDGGRIAISDTLTNTADIDVAVLIHHQITMAGPAGRPTVLLGGAPREALKERPENPTIFIAAGDVSLGMVVEDTTSRVQAEFETKADGASVWLRHFSLKAGATGTLRWAIYPDAGSGHDYWSFINRVRKDWGVNRTIDGPFEFGPGPEVWRDHEKLKAYLRRKRLRIAAFAPWLDYDNYNATTGRLLTRQEYAKLVAEGVQAFRAVDPRLKLLGPMEGPFISVPVDISRQLYDVLPEDQRGQYYPKVLTPEQLEILKGHPATQADSLVVGPKGERYYELYYRGPQRTPLVALLVYPAPGNSRLESWIDQARFITQEAGLDGVYLDGGGPVSGGRFGYDRWDGTTVDIDPATGQIARRYTDYQPVIADVPFSRLMEELRSHNKILVANGQSYAEQTQGIAAIRFIETGGAYDPLAVDDGKEPPLCPPLCVPHLGVPVALANHPGGYGEQAGSQYARFVMKSVITHLRHGLLYYYYNIEIPQSGPGSGEYGPISRMFPITPVELHEGWIVGRERIVTARSIDLHWPSDHRPEARLFDQSGREIELPPARFSATEESGRWRIRLGLDDWQQIAVVE